MPNHPVPRHLPAAATSGPLDRPASRRRRLPAIRGNSHPTRPPATPARRPRPYHDSGSWAGGSWSSAAAYEDVERESVLGYIKGAVLIVCYFVAALAALLAASAPIALLAVWLVPGSVLAVAGNVMMFVAGAVPAVLVVGEESREERRFGFTMYGFLAALVCWGLGAYGMEAAPLGLGVCVGGIVAVVAARRQQRRQAQRRSTVPGTPAGVPPAAASLVELRDPAGVPTGERTGPVPPQLIAQLQAWADQQALSPDEVLSARPATDPGTRRVSGSGAQRRPAAPLPPPTYDIISAPTDRRPARGDQ